MTDLACHRAVMPACPTRMSTAEHRIFLWNRPTITWRWHLMPRIPVKEARSCVQWQQLCRRHLHRQPVTADGKRRYWYINPLTPNDLYMSRTAPLTSKRCILYIYSTNVGTEYFKHALYFPFFSLQNAVCFTMLTCLVPVLFTFYIQGVLKIKKNNSGAKGLISFRKFVFIQKFFEKRIISGKFIVTSYL